MDSKLSLKTEVTSKQLLQAIRDIHTMSMCTISELFCVTYKFYDKDNLIHHVLNHCTAEEIVYVVATWRAQRTFNKNDIVMNYTSRNCFVVTFVDDNDITLIAADGRMSKHSVFGFDRWFKKTGEIVELEQFLVEALRDSEG